MTLKVTQIALAAGRMVGLPFVSSLDAAQKRVQDSVTDHLSSVTGLMNGILKNDDMKDFVKDNKLFSGAAVGLDYATGKKDARKNIVEGIENANSIKQPKSMETMVEASSEEIKKIAGKDEEFKKSGLELVVLNDVSEEFVHPDAVTFIRRIDVVGKKHLASNQNSSATTTISTNDS